MNVRGSEMLRACWFFLLGAPVMALAVSAAAASASAGSLQEAAQAFAGAPVRLDERIAVPACAAGFQFRWLSATADQLEASCPGSDWRMRIPVAARPVAGMPAMPRRGEVLRVEMQGEGYRVSADAVVESASQRDGTLLLRNLKSGTRFTGHVLEDGTVVAGRAGR